MDGGAAPTIDPQGSPARSVEDSSPHRGEAFFTAVYREHFAYVWRSLRRLGIRERDIADLTHDVFVVVHRKLGDYDATRPMKPWLFGIAFRTALDKKRRASSYRETLVDDVRGAASTPRADDVAISREAHDRVMSALDHLDEDKRAVFVMHELEGLSMPEIAEIVDAPINTLYSRLRLGRELFVRAIKSGGAR